MAVDPKFGWKAVARRGLREPLFHFLLAGAAIFLLFPETGGTDRRIVIDEAQVSRLAAQWAQSWQRAPTPGELDGLIRDHLKEEIYYREALRLGLNEDDAVVRRRMRAKMEFLANAALEDVTADDATLQALLDRNPSRYATDVRFSFDQIYAGADDRQGEARAKTLLAALKVGQRVEGPPLSIPANFENVAAYAISRDFGDGFADAIRRLPVGTWQGPMRSGFGLHLVRVRAVSTARKPLLSEVRKRVENDWRNATRVAREDRAFAALAQGYDIKIAKPE